MNVTKFTARNFIPKKLYGMRKTSIKKKLSKPVKIRKSKYYR